MLWLIGGLLLPLAAGCESTAPEAAMPENNFLRAQAPMLGLVAPEEIPNLLPLGTGNWWQYTVQGQDGAQAVERGVAVAQTMVTGQKGTKVDFTQNGKVSRSETYHVGSDGLFFLGAGVDQTLVMSSPMPLVQSPMHENDVVAWEGLLQFKQNSAPGRSFSRLTLREPLTTPTGKFACWRVDTVLQTNLNGRGVTQLDSRWFAPGVGMVKQVTRVGQIQTTRLLTAYKVGSKTVGKRVQ